MVATGLDALNLLEALRFAAVTHRDRRRADPHASPFINHVIDILYVLVRAGVSDISTLGAAILRDVLEDRRITPAQLEREFGADVRALVEELTDSRALPKDERRKRQLDRATTGSLRARLIMLADLIASLRTLPRHWSRTEREEYVDFTERVGTALRGIHARLDGLLADTLRQTRLALREMPARPQPPQRPLLAQLEPAGGSLEVDRQLQRLQQMLSDAEELADSIVASRGGNGNGLGQPPEPPAPPVLARSEAHADSEKTTPSVRVVLDPNLRPLAEPGVGSIDILPLDPQRSLVSIDGADGFPVPLGLAHLLSLIASRTGQSDDGFVPFRTLSDLARQLEGREGQGAWNTHRVTAALSRLRRVLQRAGHVNPWLVQTCRRRGARFRLRWAPGRDQA
jgi:HD domain